MFVALTVDVDPDANRAVPGSTDAVSAGAEGGVRLEGCRVGLDWIVDAARQLGLPCTLFWEVRTLQRLQEDSPRALEGLRDARRVEHCCHGMRHEDFAGRDSGRPMDADRTREVIEEASRGFEEVFGNVPLGFRAPYCRLTDHLVDALAELDYRYDASRTVEPGDGRDLRPFRLDEGRSRLWEVPLCRWRDAGGEPISGYLWQMMESRRRAGDYLDMAAAVARKHPVGLLQFALHPWHLAVGEDGRWLSDRERRRNRTELECLLRGLLEMEKIRFTTVGAYLEGLAGECCRWKR